MRRLVLMSFVSLLFCGSATNALGLALQPLSAPFFITKLISDLADAKKLLSKDPDLLDRGALRVIDDQVFCFIRHLIIGRLFNLIKQPASQEDSGFSLSKALNYICFAVHIVEFWHGVFTMGSVRWRGKKAKQYTQFTRYGNKKDVKDLKEAYSVQKTNAWVQFFLSCALTYGSLALKYDLLTTNRSSNSATFGKLLLVLAIIRSAHAISMRSSFGAAIDHGVNRGKKLKKEKKRRRERERDMIARAARQF